MITTTGASPLPPSRSSFVSSLPHSYQAIAKYRAKVHDLENEIANAKKMPVLGKNEPLAMFIPKGHPSHGALCTLHFCSQFLVKSHIKYRMKLLLVLINLTMYK